MAKTNKRKRFGKKGRGRTRFNILKNLFVRKTAPVSFEQKDILDESANIPVKEKPVYKKDKLTRGKDIAPGLNDEYIEPQYNSNSSSNSSIDILNEEPSAKINFNSKYYDSRNGSPTTVDDINIGFGGKRKRTTRKVKRRYKK